MWVLLEIGHFCLLFFKFTAGLIRGRVLFEDLRCVELQSFFKKVSEIKI